MNTFTLRSGSTRIADDTATARCIAGATWNGSFCAAQCSDGLDNDGDSFTDYPDDLGCTDADDNDETDTLPDPTITVTPAVVRQGSDFLLEWNPNGNPGCVLSNNAPSSANGSTAGSVTLTANRQSTYTISCANGNEASVTLQVIPNLFET